MSMSMDMSKNDFVLRVMHERTRNDGSGHVSSY